jgi:dTDP-4-dehydrorhamnose 3,5-epimerase-like enzyme
MDKIQISSVPIGREHEGVKRWDEDRGEFIQVTYGEEVRHVALFQIRKGFTRGNHYHEKKDEGFYVVSGRIGVLFLDMDTGERAERIVEKGNCLRIAPRCGHLFEALEEAWVVEYSPQAYDKADAFRIDLRQES